MDRLAGQKLTFVLINRILPKASVYNSNFDFCWSTPFAIRLVKWRRPDLGELISECSTVNIDFLFRSWNNKQYYKLKIKCFFILMTHLLYLLRRWVNSTSPGSKLNKTSLPPDKKVNSWGTKLSLLWVETNPTSAFSLWTSVLLPPDVTMLTAFTDVITDVADVR